MSIRALAKEIYRCQSTVHRLEDQWAKSSPMEKEALKEELRLARAELIQLKKMLEGRKEQSTLPDKLKRFLR